MGIRAAGGHWAPARVRWLGWTLAAAWLAAAPGIASAHRDDYLDETFVFMTLERGEFEPEYWLDLGRHARGAGDFVRHNLSAEYGLTPRWTIDGRATFDDEPGRRTHFASGRMESRVRFGDEGSRPVGVAASAEVETERAEDGGFEATLQPRLVLSRDVGELNATLNLIEEIPLGDGQAAFLVSSGARYGERGLLRLGSELKYDFRRSAGAVIPQVWLAFPHRVTVKLGVSRGLARNRGDFVRLAFEVEL